MLWNASKINGYGLAARDGKIGNIVDLLFDDTSWHVRWAVVETGNWLSGKKVLLPTLVLGHRDATEGEFSVDLTMQQIKDSPDIDTERPVSRQMETDVYDHYGWSPYWGNSALMGGIGFMGGYGYGGGLVSPSQTSDSRREEQDQVDAQREHDDPHLRSVEAVTGYHIHASDGDIGHIEDFLVEDADWGIHYLVVDTKNWWPGKKVLISPRSVQGIDWNDRLVEINVSRDAVKASPAYEISTLVDPNYENHFNNYYGGIGPSNRP